MALSRKDLDRAMTGNRLALDKMYPAVAAAEALPDIFRIPVLPDTSWDYARSGSSNLYLGDGGKLTTTLTHAQDASVTNPIDPLSWETDGSANGTHNTFVGIGSGLVNVSGNFNTFVGTNTGRATVNGDQNTYVGAWAGMGSVDSWHCTFIGVGAGQDIVHGYLNTFVGCDCALSSTDGEGNTFVGASSGSANAGDNNCVVGVSAFKDNTTGDGNCCMGVSSLGANTTGSYNVAVGHQGMVSNTTGSYNTASGYQALVYAVGGSYNIGIGYQAGAKIANGIDNNTTSTTSIYIGAGSRSLSVGRTNEIVIGTDAIGLGSNTAVLGGSSITITRLQGSVGIGTDAPGYPFCVKGANANQYLAWFGVTEANNSKALLQVTGGTTATATWLIGNNGGNKLFTMDSAGVLGAEVFKTTTAMTANSSGTVAIVAKDAGVATANAGWIKMQKSDGVDVYVPCWT